MDLKRLAARTALALVLIPAIAFLGDWAVWRVKLAHGAGMGSIPVNRIVVAPLKGGREEYYPDGTAELDCSQSLFPQAGSGACWWIARHRTVFVR